MTASDALSNRPTWEEVNGPSPRDCFHHPRQFHNRNTVATYFLLASCAAVALFGTSSALAEADPSPRNDVPSFVPCTSIWRFDMAQGAVGLMGESAEGQPEERARSVEVAAGFHAQDRAGWDACERGGVESGPGGARQPRRAEVLCNEEKECREWQEAPATRRHVNKGGDVTGRMGEGVAEATLSCTFGWCFAISGNARYGT